MIIASTSPPPSPTHSHSYIITLLAITVIILTIAALKTLPLRGILSREKRCSAILLAWLNTLSLRALLSFLVLSTIVQ